MKNKENKIIKVIALLGLFLLVFGMSYALFSVVLEGTKKNKITTGTLSLKLTDIEGHEETEGYGINLENAYPMSTREALETLEPYEFIIENDGSLDADYELYIEVSDTTTLGDDAVRYNLVQTDMTGISEVISVFGVIEESLDDEPMDSIEEMNIVRNSRALSNIKTTKDGKVLYKLDLGTIPSKQKYKYSLKMWVNYSAKNEAMNKTFEGKLKIYGTQTTKDSAYVVEKVDLTSYQSEEQGQLKLFAKKYSDNSLRIEGFGIVPSNIDDLNFIKLLYNTYYTDNLLVDLNAALAKDGIAPYDDIATCIMDGESLNVSESVSKEIENIFNNIDSYHKYNNLYIGEGIVEINGELFADKAFDKLYVSKTVQRIKGFSNSPYLKEVNFFEFEDPKYQILIDYGNDLSIDDFTFGECDFLTKVHILDNLGRIGNSAFYNDKNAVIEIEAKKENVSFSETGTFQNVKEVKWLNG